MTSKERRVYVRVEPIGQESEDGEDADAIGVFRVHLPAGMTDSEAIPVARSAVVSGVPIGPAHDFEFDVHDEAGELLAPAVSGSEIDSRRGWLALERVADHPEAEPWTSASPAGRPS